MSKARKEDRVKIRRISTSEMPSIGLAVRMDISDEFGKYERQVLIPFEQVKRYYEATDNISVVELNDKTKINVYISFDEFKNILSKSITRKHSVDLTKHTGKIACNKHWEQKLERIFNLNQQKHNDIDDRIFILYGYPDDTPASPKYMMIIAESDVEKISYGESAFFHMKNWHDYREEFEMNTRYGPFVSNNVRNNFRDVAAKAKSDNILVVDMRDDDESTPPNNLIKITPRVKRLIDMF